MRMFLVSMLIAFFGKPSLSGMHWVELVVILICLFDFWVILCFGYNSGNVHFGDMRPDLVLSVS